MTARGKRRSRMLTRKLHRDENTVAEMERRGIAGPADPDQGELPRDVPRKAAGLDEILAGLEPEQAGAPHDK